MAIDELKVSCRRPHIVAVAHLSQGHISSPIHFCLKLAHHGILVTFVTIHVDGLLGMGQRKDPEVPEQWKNNFNFERLELELPKGTGGFAKFFAMIEELGGPFEELHSGEEIPKFRAFMERAEAARKRRRVAGYDTGESWQQIKALNCKDLLNPNQVTMVPCMGTCNRGSFLFVGSPDMDELLWHCLSLEPGQELVVVGPKGTGKSCRLRAMAAALYARGPEKSVIVCVWNLERASSPTVLLRWLLDGLCFAYSGADEHKPVLEALEALWRVGVSVARLQEFLRERAAAGDDFTFVADGAEALGTRDYRGMKKVDCKELKDTLLTLEAIVSPYKIVWGVSPEARQAEAADSERVAIYCVGGFTKEQREVFLRHSMLGAVVTGDMQRTKDMDFLAGFHPQFLDELDGACMEIARIKQAGGRKSRLLWGDTVRLAPPVELEPHEVSLLLKDEEDWQRVLLEFINGRTMSFIRRSVREVVRILDNAEVICNFHQKTQTIDKDPRYSISEHEFCSCFVEQIYMEEFRKARSCRQQEHAAWWNTCDWPTRF